MSKLRMHLQNIACIMIFEDLYESLLKFHFFHHAHQNLILNIRDLLMRCIYFNMVYLNLNLNLTCIYKFKSKFKILSDKNILLEYNNNNFKNLFTNTSILKRIDLLHFYKSNWIILCCLNTCDMFNPITIRFAFIESFLMVDACKTERKFGNDSFCFLSLLLCYQFD